MRVFGGLRAFYYLQTLLTGDNETGRNPARFHTRRTLCPISSNMKGLKTILRNIYNWNWDKIANISVVIGIFIAIFTFNNSNRQFKENIRLSEQLFRKDSILFEKQIELSHNPVVKIFPEEGIETNQSAEFTLKIINTGQANVSNIEIFEDYFVCLTPPNEKPRLYSFGIFTTKSENTIPSLSKGDTSSFNIEFRKTYERMKEFYLSDIKGQRMNILRLTIKYNRKVDGKNYELKKAYIIGGGAELLLDYDDRGIKFRDLTTISDVKKILEIEE